MKYTVVFDFDGVIHSYKSGWKGAEVIPDPPVEGIREAIADIRNADYEVAVVSTRCATPAGLEAVKTYLANNDIIVDKVCAEKPPAIVYIDDRALCFDGQCHTLLEKIKNFKPWYQSSSTDSIPCRWCDNARVNPELTDENDFASYTIGEACKNFRIMFTVGSGKPPRIEFETWNNDHWSTVGVYYPKHCPNCGREINEYGGQDDARLEKN